MKKNKEWLKESIKNSELVSSAKLYDLIDHLDEPEQCIDAAHDLLQEITTLSQEDFDLYWNCINDGIAVSDLKQEKVVIPQFVADFITEIKPNFNIRTVFTLKNNKHEQGQEWALDNPDVFARAWLDGYTVEKESQWVVKTGKNWFFKNFESVGEYNYQAIGTGSIEEAKKFKDKLEAESIALLSDGEVEEVTE